MLDGSPYQGYLYAYPHKTVYRPLRPRPRLRDVWAGEPRDALFLYLHVPFCEMRCGFCNLFTRGEPAAEEVRAYLRQLRRQAERVAARSGPTRFARSAIGGGTPTYLTADELERAVRHRHRVRRRPRATDVGGDVAGDGDARPARGAGRARRAPGQHRRAELHRRRGARGRPTATPRRGRRGPRRHPCRRPIPALNLDLIYGIPGQTAGDLAESIRTRHSRWKPEEIFLYPLYVRPLTGLGRRSGPARPSLGRRTSRPLPTGP